MGLLPGSLTPSLAEDLALLGSRLPFGQAAELTGHFRMVDVSEATVRRTTERSGQAWVELQREAVEALEAEPREAAEGPALQQLSVDGAMVPLLHGEWAEVKTLVIGTIEEPASEGEAHARELSYFSRMMDHQSFARLATVETHRRGTERAARVCAVMDGAEWQQKFIDLHRPDAVRILDWCHAAEHLAQAGQAAFGAGTAALSEWLGIQLHRLKHGEPEEVLGSLRGLCRELEQRESGVDDEGKAVKGSLEYLEKRKGQIRYAEFHAEGYPIGSGAVESANKLVVEARLKGSGMHWARKNVDPMLALRTVVCSERWGEVWPEICRRLGEKAGNGRHTNPKTPERPVERETPDLKTNSRVREGAEHAPRSSQATHGHGKTSSPDAHFRPPANHPWRRMTIGTKHLSPKPTHQPNAKI